jgi:hypothetical protein
MPHIASNEKLLKSYGFIKQDFKKEEEKSIELTLTPNITDSFDGMAGVITLPSLEDLTLLESESLRLKYSEVFGKKAGNKSDATILKELQDKLTIQN